MSWAWSDALRALRTLREGSWSVWVGPQGLWALPPDGDAARVEARPWAQWADWCREHPGARARLVVSTQWVSEWLADDGLPLPDAAAQLAHALPLLKHYHGPEAERWTLAAWSQDGLKGVSALHGFDLAAARAAAQRSGVQVLGVHPAWSRLLMCAGDRLARSGEWTCLWVEGSAVTVMAFRGHRLRGLQQRHLREASLQDLADRWMGWSRGGREAASESGLRTMTEATTGRTTRPLQEAALAASVAAAAAPTVPVPRVAAEAQSDAAQALPPAWVVGAGLGEAPGGGSALQRAPDAAGRPMLQVPRLGLAPLVPHPVWWVPGHAGGQGQG